MKAKIILHIEGDKKAIEYLYQEIIHNDAVLNRVKYWEETDKKQEFNEISAIVTRTEIKEDKW